MDHPPTFLSIEISFLEVGRQEICYIQSHFLLITVFLTFMVSKDTVKIWEKKKLDSDTSIPSGRVKKKKIKWNSLNVFVNDTYNNSMHHLNNNALLSMNGKVLIWICVLIFFNLKYFDLRALILFGLFDLLPILGLILFIHWNCCLPDTFQMNKKSLDLK